MKLSMKKINHYIDYMIASLLGILVLVMFMQVLFRYIFNHSLSWSEELAKFIFIWVTFLGAAVCFRDRMHISIDFLVERLSVKQKTFLEFFNMLLSLIFSGIMVAIGFLWVRDCPRTSSPALDFPYNLVFYGALPLSMLFSFIYELIRLIKEFNKIK